jgi:ligand-binding SRPBCC domain-containing protein
MMNNRLRPVRLGCGFVETVLCWRKEIRAPADRVWARVTDFPRMPEWFLGVRRVALAAREPAAGVERLLTLRSGISHRERIAAWEPCRSFAVEVLEPPFFARGWRGDIALDERDGATSLDWRLRYTPRFGSAGRALDRLLVRPVLGLAFRASLRRLAAGLERPRGTAPR